MNVSDMIRAMKAAGCSDEQIVGAVENIDAPKRALNAARQRRFRERHVTQSNVTVRDVTRSNVSNVTVPPKKNGFPPHPPYKKKHLPR